MTTGEQTGVPAANTRSNAINVSIMTPAIGAEVSGVDLSASLSDNDYAQLRALLLRHKLLVFRDQDIAPAQHVAFAKRFGELEIHPVFQHHSDFPELALLGGNKQSGRENLFHSDVTWRENPSMGSILRCVECPDNGGDTIWVNMALAYEELPEYVKQQLAGLIAVHDIMPTFIDRIPLERREKIRNENPPQMHPVVRVHPETGEKILFVNEGFTTHLANFIESPGFAHFSDLRDGGSSLLQFLCSRAKRPEYQVRLKWRPNTIAFWDNRATQHYAIQDYFPAIRRMMRATIIGTKPA
ncbi:TauD/TfdA family dioxygenase [Cupriavidus necator]